MKRLIFIIVGIVLIPGLSLAGPVKGDDLRVLSYNIHMWRPGVENLASVIKSADADIAGLNEAWNGVLNEELAPE